MRAQRRRRRLWLCLLVSGFSSRSVLRLLREACGAFSCLRWRSTILRDSPSLSKVSAELAFETIATRIDVYEENERRSSPHAVLGSENWRDLKKKRARTQPPKRSTGAVFSHANSHPRKERGHMIQRKRPQRCNKKDTKMSLGCRRAGRAARVGARIRPDRRSRSASARHPKTRRSTTSTGKWPSSSSSLIHLRAAPTRALAVARVSDDGAARGAAATRLAAGLAAVHHKEILRVPGNASTRRGAVARTVPKRAVGVHRRGPPNEPRPSTIPPPFVCVVGILRARIPQVTPRRRPDTAAAPSCALRLVSTYRGGGRAQSLSALSSAFASARELFDRRDRAAPLAPL